MKSRPLSLGVEHPVDVEAIALGRVVDVDVRDRAHDLAVLQDGAAAHG